MFCRAEWGLLAELAQWAPFFPQCGVFSSVWCFFSSVWCFVFLSVVFCFPQCGVLITQWGVQRAQWGGAATPLGSYTFTCRLKCMQKL